MKTPRLSPETFLVLERFLERPTDWRYGYELSRATGLKSGTLYPILMRLEKYGLLEARWVGTQEGVQAPAGEEGNQAWRPPGIGALPTVR